MNAIKDSIKSGRTVVGTTVTPNVDVSILADAGRNRALAHPYSLHPSGPPLPHRSIPHKILNIISELCPTRSKSLHHPENAG